MNTKRKLAVILSIAMIVVLVTAAIVYSSMKSQPSESPTMWKHVFDWPRGSQTIQNSTLLIVSVFWIENDTLKAVVYINNGTNPLQALLLSFDYNGNGYVSDDGQAIMYPDNKTLPSFTSDWSKDVGVAMMARKNSTFHYTTFNASWCTFTATFTAPPNDICQINYIVVENMQHGPEGVVVRFHIMEEY